MFAEIYQLLRLELRYFRVLLLVGLVALVIFATIYSLTDTYRALIETGTFVQIVVVISIAVTQSMDKRDRLYRILPVKRKSVSLLHSLPLFYTSLVVWCVWIVFAQFGTDTPALPPSNELFVDITVRFLLNLITFQTMALGFELSERAPILGIPLVTVLGAVFGYTTVKLVQNSAQVFGDALENYLGIEGSLLLPMMIGIVLLLYVLDSWYAYHKPLSKYSMK